MNSTRCRRIHVCTPINSLFRKYKLQKNRTLLGISVFCVYFRSIWCVLSINTGEQYPPAGKAQIREDGKSDNISIEEKTMKKIIRNICEEYELFITTEDLSYPVISVFL